MAITTLFICRTAYGTDQNPSQNKQKQNRNQQVGEKSSAAAQPQDPNEHVHFLFAHGSGWDKNTVDLYVNQYKRSNVLPENVHTPMFNDVDNLRMSSLGQEEDIHTLTSEIRKIAQQDPNSKIICFGVSRGAVALINTVGSIANKQPDLLRNISGLALEAPFADAKDVAHVAFNNILNDKIGIRFNNPISRFIAKKGLPQVAGKHDPEGIQPITSIQSQWDNVRKDLPIFMIHSEKDATIPIKESHKLVKKLVL